MEAIDKGLGLVSVADVVFFDPVDDTYIGDGLAMTDTSLTQEVQSIQQRGGYLNSLLFDVKIGKSVTVTLTSATFKMEYLAFQTGTSILTDNFNDIYKFNECVVFTNGVGQTADMPTGNVFVKLPSGAVKSIKPQGSSVDIGMPTFSGSLQVTYRYNESASRVVIDAKSQPLVVKAVMKAHIIDQNGKEGTLQITIPRLKLNGSITLTMTSDAISTFEVGGTALEYDPGCGEGGYYATVTIINPQSGEVIPVSDIVASPNRMTLSLAGNKSATANVIGVRSAPYSNVVLDNANLTFASSDNETASVTDAGLITGLKAGDAQITVSYQGLQDIISVSVGE